MSKTPKTQTTVQETSYPDFVDAAQRDYYDRAGNYFKTQFDKGGTPLAGLTANQKQAGGLLKSLASGGGGYTPKTVSGQDIVAQMNPFLGSVGKETLNSMRLERDNAAASIAARSANGVAFGGSGDAIARGQLERGYSENVGSTIANLMSAGYDRATAVALANANAENSASQFGADQKLSATNGLMSYGSLQQQQQQLAKDRQWALLQRYGSVIPGIGGSTSTTSPDNSPSFLQQLLGTGLTIGGMATGGGGTVLGNLFS